MKTEHAAQAPKKRTTVVDVARLAGVSPGTVSNAISGKRKVDSDTRARIDVAIAQLGYVPNLAARGMRTGRANAIAIVSSMPTAVAAGPSKLGFLMEIAASAAATALEHNYALVLVPPIDAPDRLLANTTIDGAIIVEPETDDPVLSALRERGLPVVVIGPPAGDAAALSITLDYDSMADLLTRHLLDAGARNFPLIVGHGDRASNHAFRRVYCAVLAERGLKPRVLEIAETDAEQGAEAAVLAEIDAGRPMDGLLVPVDAMATGAMSALRRRGLTVPGDVKVATRYDGIRARSETPPLTALDMRLEDTARLATAALIAALDGKAGGDVPAAPPARLVIRGSTRA